MTRHQRFVQHRDKRRVLFLCAALVCATAAAVAAACARHQPRDGESGETGAVRQNEQVVPVIYAALGDSTGVGVGAQRGGGYVARLFTRIERLRPNSRLVNLCVSGATTADVLRDQVARLERENPTLLTLGIGINDVNRNVPVEQFARNYEEIITRLREKTNAPIVVSNIPDVSFAPAVPVALRETARRRITLYNQRIAEVAARRRLPLVDAYTKSHEVIPAHPEFFSADNFHPSEAGYEFWAVLMWPTVKEALTASAGGYAPAAAGP